MLEYANTPSGIPNRDLIKSNKCIELHISTLSIFLKMAKDAKVNNKNSEIINNFSQKILSIASLDKASLD